MKEQVRVKGSADEEIHEWVAWVRRGQVDDVSPAAVLPAAQIRSLPYRTAQCRALPQKMI